MQKRISRTILLSILAGVPYPLILRIFVGTPTKATVILSFVLLAIQLFFGIIVYISYRKIMKEYKNNFGE